MTTHLEANGRGVDKRRVGFAFLMMATVLGASVLGVARLGQTPDPVAVLEKAIQVHAQVQSMQIDAHVEKFTGLDARRSEQSSISQISLTASRYREFNALGELSYERRTIGSSAYIYIIPRIAATQAYWESLPGPSAPERALSLSFVKSVRLLKEVKFVASKTLDDGTPVMYYRGSTDLTKKAGMLWPNWESLDSDERRYDEQPREQLLAGQENLELWIEKDTNLLRRVRIDAAYPQIDAAYPQKLSLERYSITSTYDYGHYNEAFGITPPPVELIKS